MIGNAGVLIGIYEEYIILTKRSAQLRSFTGHVCLPGGKYDFSDHSIVDTAVREFYEEVFFSGNVNPLFCMMPESSIKTGQYVYPVVALLDGGSVRGFNQDEVEKLIFLKYEDLKESIFKINSDYPQIKHNKCFDYEGEFVWGLTAHILFKFTQQYKYFFKG